MTQRTRVALIGASARGLYAFAAPILRRYHQTHELVGMFDINPRRMQVLNEHLEAAVPAFTDLDALVQKTRPELFIITTVDATHVDYIEAAFRSGVRCICEKPLCINAEQCRRIRAAQAARPDLPAVTAHNYRYSPYTGRVKDLLDSGAIGAIRNISFREMLDHRHGSSYFRRWNRRKQNSGGLLVHKASHCFDVMNWWVGSRPRSLVARGSLTAYGAAASPFRGERCSTCEHGTKCPQYIDLTKDTLRSKLYFQAREPGAYTPDLCVFSPEIDAEDYATVAYDYENGVQVSFELCAYAAYEGVDVAIEGSTGRLEYVHRHSTGKLTKSARHGTEESMGESLRLWRFDQPPEVISVDQVKGGHGGADPRMLAELFDAAPPSKARATLEDGIQAVLIGAAANVSIVEHRPVNVQALIKQ